MPEYASYPKFKGWKANGVSPASGYYLYTYESGTTTPKTTYADAGLASANANPIVLNANGEADIFLGSGAYRFDLKTPAGALIWTFDPIQGSGVSIDSVNNIAELRTLSTQGRAIVQVLGYYAPGDDGGGLFYFDQISSTADDGGTVIRPNSAPAVGRWKRVFKEYMSVKWFGATGDGATLDTAAITAANAAIAVSGGELYFPQGTYLVNASYSFASNVHVTMHSNAKVTAGTSQTLTFGSTTELPDSQHFAGSMTAVFPNGSMVHPEWWGCVGNGVVDDTAAMNLALAVSGANVELRQGATYLIGNALYITQSRKKIYGYGSGFKRKNTSVGAWSPSNGPIMYIADPNYATTGAAITDVEILGLKIDGNKSNNISVNSGDGIRLVGASKCVIQDCFLTSLGRDAVTLGGDNFTAGSFVNGASPAASNDNLIVNNRIWDIGLVGMNGGNGVAITAGSRNIIANNNIRGDAALASATTACIDIEPNNTAKFFNECANNVIIGNTVDFVRVDQGIANYCPDRCIIKFQTAGYVAAVDADLGKTVTQGSITGVLQAYNNTSREWVLSVAAGVFKNGVAVTPLVTTGAGGTLDFYRGYRGAVNGTTIQGNTLMSSDDTKGGLYAIRLRGTTGVKAMGNTIRHASGYGIQADGAVMGLLLDGNHVTDGAVGISLPNSGYESVISNNTVRGNTGEGIVCNGGDYLILKGNEVSFNGLIGMTASGNNYVQLEGNSVHDNQQDGIKLFACSRVNIINNRSIDNGLAANNTYDALYINGTYDYIRIEGNTLGSQAATTNKVRYCLNETGTTTAETLRMGVNEYLSFAGAAACNLVSSRSSQLMDERWQSLGAFFELRDGFGIYYGSASPEGALSARMGSIYIQYNTSDRSVWFKNSGTNTNTGWRALSGGIDRTGLKLDMALTGNVNQTGLESGATFGSGATSSGIAGYFRGIVTNAAFTMANLIGVNVDSPSKGASATVTNNYAIKVENQAVAGATNYAFDSGTGYVRHRDRFQLARANSVASATDVTLPDGGNVFPTTGTVTINRIATANWQIGSQVTLELPATAVVAHRGVATGGGFARINLNGGANLTAGAGAATLTLMYNGTDWFEVASASW